jgi:hypothetical protein
LWRAGGVVLWVLGGFLVSFAIGVVWCCCVCWGWGRAPSARATALFAVSWHAFVHLRHAGKDADAARLVAKDAEVARSGFQRAVAYICHEVGGRSRAA